MNDQLILDNYLLILKSTVEVYVHGTLESSNKDVKDLLKNCLSNTLDSQESTYNIMTSTGFYNVTNIDSNTIMQTLTKIKSKN